MKIISRIIEAIFWFWIALSTSLIGIIAGTIIYLYFRTTLSLIVGLLISIGGVFVGILWAERVRRKKGASTFMASVIATPEFDFDPNKGTIGTESEGNKDESVVSNYDEKN